MIKCKIDACVFILPIFRNYTTDPVLLTQPSVTGYKGSNSKHLVRLILKYLDRTSACLQRNR